MRTPAVLSAAPIVAVSANSSGFESFSATGSPAINNNQLSGNKSASIVPIRSHFSGSSSFRCLNSSLSHSNITRVKGAENVRELRPESRNLLHLDCLRFVAALGIVIFHLSGKIYPIGPALASAIHGLALFVDLFFVISGFVIAYVYWDQMRDTRDYGSFLVKRLARIAPLHWIILGIFLVLTLCMGMAGRRMNDAALYDINCVPSHIFFLHAMGLCARLTFNTPSWSLSAEMVMYAITPLFFVAAHRSTWVLAGVVGGVIAVLTALSNGGEWTQWTAAGGALRAIPSFGLGVLLFCLRDRLCWRYGMEAMWLGLAVFLAEMVAGAPWLALLATLYAVAFMAVCADGFGSAAAPVRHLAGWAQLTYSSYMTHYLVLLIVITGVGQYGVHASGWKLNGFVIAAFLAVWPVSYFSLVYVERPLRSVVRNLGGTIHLGYHKQAGQ
jgi:peptidoglycan/LPS O-acetylase OafA/YrhL